MPAFAYRMQGNDPLIMKDPNNNSILYKNWQLWEHLLCESCERKFDEHGENYMSKKNFTKSGEFLLRDNLKKINPRSKHNSVRNWHAYDVDSEIDVERIKYFALSVLWRFSVCSVAAPDNKGALGITYEEKFRRYLNNQTGFPDKVFISIRVNFDRDPASLVYHPTMARMQVDGISGFEHKFCIPGLLICIYLGEAAKKMISNVSTDTIFREWSFLRSDFGQGIRGNVMKSIPKGKLAKEDNLF